VYPLEAIKSCTVGRYLCYIEAWSDPVSFFSLSSFSRHSDFHSSFASLSKSVCHSFHALSCFQNEVLYLCCCCCSWICRRCFCSCIRPVCMYKTFCVKVDVVSCVLTLLLRAEMDGLVQLIVLPTTIVQFRMTGTISAFPARDQVDLSL
jgi:hypothetical protein